MTEDIWRRRIAPAGHCKGWGIKELVSGEQVGALPRVDILGPGGSWLG